MSWSERRRRLGQVRNGNPVCGVTAASVSGGGAAAQLGRACSVRQTAQAQDRATRWWMTHCSREETDETSTAVRQLSPANTTLTILQACTLKAATRSMYDDAARC